jgi:hypothetical protein
MIFAQTSTIKPLTLPEWRRRLCAPNTAFIFGSETPIEMPIEPTGLPGPVRSSRCDTAQAR